MTSQAGGIPRYRRFDGLPLFRQGFRPFFLGAGAWAVVSVALWVPMLGGVVSIQSAFAPVDWHAHEMLFGFVTAAIGGFLLTAIPNWTGRMPLQGYSLMALFAAWLAGRLAMMFSDTIGVGLAAVLELSFLTLLLAAVLREIIVGRNWRNLPVCIAVGILLIANFLTHLDAMDIAPTGALGFRLGIAVVVAMIALIGGRIVPSFTRNWLSRHGAARLPASFGRFDQVSLGVLIPVLVVWVASPDGPVVGAAMIAAGVVTLIRLARWRGHRSLGEPLVWSLHLGFLWVPVGLLLTGLSAVWPVISATAGMHALTAGAMAAMTLAVMTRASLGHTGRPLVADGWTTAIYLCAAAAAALRVGAAIATAAYVPLLWASGVAWSAAFAIFTVRYGRLLLTR